MARSQTVVGIDPSLSTTAVCYGPLDNMRTKIFRSAAQGQDVVNRIDRDNRLAIRVAQFVGTLNPGLIVIENYSFGSQYSREKLGEYGGLLRLRLMAVCRDWTEVAVTSLKVWATSNGRASKGEIADALRERYGVTFGTDDEADAFCLWRIGWQMLELDQPYDSSQQKTLDKLKPKNGLAVV